jgi:archaemetzincin
VKNGPTKGRVILVAPIDFHDTDVHRELATEIERVYGVPCRISSILSDISFAHDIQRDQFNSSMILKELESNAPPNAVKVIALTSRDLFIPILTYVYGEAQLGGRCAIVSVYRLRGGISGVDSRRVFLWRVVKECIHELGHTFALKHCRDGTCIMHYARDIKDVDTKARELCRYCNVLLSDELSKM